MQIQKKPINLQPSMVKGGERVDRGLPHGSAGTESTCDARDTGYSPKGSQESVTTERLGMHKRRVGRQLGETRTHTQGRQAMAGSEARESALLKDCRTKIRFLKTL